ncbi:MAG: hypothetical protein HY925_08080 [Elusimicrobia bacterium]|nr:hypothetical protein [Elusimicrobiota bacterium]
MTLALLALLWAAPCSADVNSMHRRFLDDQAKKMKDEGYALKKKVVAPSSDGGKLAAYVFTDSTGQYDRLIVWHLKNKAAGKIYIEPSSSFRVELERVHDKGKFPDLYGDGSRTLAYRTYGGGSKALHLVRFVGNRPEPEQAPLPEGYVADIDGDGAIEVVTRSLPLGRLYSIDCGDFHSRAGQNAWKTVIYGFEKGKLVDASARYASFYNEHIAQLEGDISVMDPRANQRYGEFMGAALAIYFDHAQKGMPRQGWARFTELFRPGDGDPAGTSDCIRQAKEDVRRKLGLPDGW